MSAYVPVLILFIFAAVFAGVFLLLSYVFGPRNPTKEKNSVYECGVPPTGEPRKRFSVKFYLVALLFIIFDVEIVFLYPWAVNLKKGIAEGRGISLLVVMGIFFFLLMLGLFFEWRKGVLDWGDVAKGQRDE